VRESRTPGSVRGDRGNPVPYRVRIKPGQGNHPYKRAAGHELAVVSRICSEAGAPLMANEPHSDSSPSSPGQSNRREELIRIFDKLNDAGKQELLRLAKELERCS
jgi:hypothetical protein